MKPLRSHHRFGRATSRYCWAAAEAATAAETAHFAWWTGQTADGTLSTCKQLKSTLSKLLHTVSTHFACFLSCQFSVFGKLNVRVLLVPSTWHIVPRVEVLRVEWRGFVFRALFQRMWTDCFLGLYKMRRNGHLYAPNLRATTVQRRIQAKKQSPFCRLHNVHFHPLKVERSCMSAVWNAARRVRLASSVIAFPENSNVNGTRSVNSHFLRKRFILPTA